MESGLPLLFICTNNQYGISTNFGDVHGQSNITKLAEGYGMPAVVVNGNDVEESYAAISEAIAYIREHRKPYFLEAMVSRLRGHSSSSGAVEIPTVDNPKDYIPGENEIDPIRVWAKKLVRQKIISKNYLKEELEKGLEEMAELLQKVKQEEEPSKETIYNHTFKQELGIPKDYE